MRATFQPSRPKGTIFRQVRDLLGTTDRELFGTAHKLRQIR